MVMACAYVCPMAVDVNWGNKMKNNYLAFKDEADV